MKRILLWGAPILVAIVIQLKMYLDIALQTEVLYPSDVSTLHSSLIEWERKGKYSRVHGYDIFGINIDPSPNKLTFIIVHGYPSSSFEYSYGAVDALISTGYGVVVHDHVGFGFSEKPWKRFGYSVQDHADIAISYWESVGVSGDCVFVAHDMGDSILTEILARYVRSEESLPANINLKGVIFTNGGMSLRGVNLRLSQSILMSVYGEYFNKLTSVVDKENYFFRQQLKTVFSDRIRLASSESSTGKLRDHQIDMMLSQLQLNGGMGILWKTIRYIHDRYACQDRWLSALSKLRKPIRFIWGAADAVAPKVIPGQVVEVAELHGKGSIIHYVEDTGHFLMMEDGQGDRWAELVINAAADMDE